MLKQIKIKLSALIAALLLCNMAFSQISANQIDSAFKTSRLKIEGEGRTCTIINSFSGDLNNDGKEDLLVYYSCGISGTIGKGTTGGGWAIWIYKNGILQFLLKDENKFGLAPLQILPDGIINCDQLEYNSDSGKPSVIGKKQVKLVKNALVILK